MDLMDAYLKLAGLLPTSVASRLSRGLKAVPFVKKIIEKEYAKMAKDMEAVARPYKDGYAAFTKIPDVGLDKDDIVGKMEELQSLEEPRWKEGLVSGAVYHGAREHIDFLNKVYAINSQSNPLHVDLWPSTVKYEAEVVSMVANMLGADSLADDLDPGERICGSVSSGGTESILLAMKSYRDWARDRKGITSPEMIIPSTAHAAFDKAARYFNIKPVHIPVGPDYRADVISTRKAVTKNTMVIVGSSPSFPHGVIDPIEELSELARKKDIGFHTDACLGGFVLPWAERLGYEIPPYDFRLPGVTSMSVDTHKFGYASKGTSVILYRGLELRHYQYFKSTDWSGGIYFTPTFAGSRPGALSATCWAALTSMGENGYLEATGKILKTARVIKEGIGEIPELHIIGDPLWVIAFGSETLDIYRVMEYMTEMGWSLNGLQLPPCVHICVTLRHTQDGVAQKFIDCLRSATRHVKKNPTEKGRMAPIYGTAATFPDREVIGDALEMFLDILYKV